MSTYGKFHSCNILFVIYFFRVLAIPGKVLLGDVTARYVNSLDGVEFLFVYLSRKSATLRK